MTRAVRRFRWVRRGGILFCKHPPGKEESEIDFIFSQRKGYGRASPLLFPEFCTAPASCQALVRDSAY